MAKKQKAAGLLDRLMVGRQSNNTDQDSLNAFVEALQQQAEGPLDPRLDQAQKERRWARLAAASGDAKEAQELMKHAEYLEFCYQWDRKP